MWHWIVAIAWLGLGYISWGCCCASVKVDFHIFHLQPTTLTRVVLWSTLPLFVIVAPLFGPFALWFLIRQQGTFIPYPETLQEWREIEVVNLLSE